MKLSELENTVKSYKARIGIPSFDLEPMVDDFITFNHMIGLPKHPQTLLPCPMTKIQLHLVETGIPFKGQVRLHLNKARQCGWTETILRVLAFHSFHKYAGKKIIIIPGTREKTTKDIFYRFEQLFRNIPEYVVESQSLFMRLTNGTEIYGMPANPEAVTGWTKIGAIFMDEAAKWNLVDDYPVINAIMPIVRTNKSDLFMISTPKGPRGFFYDFDIADNTFKKFVIDIWEGGAEMYTKSEMQEMIESSEEDPDQEYLNKYTTGRDSIWGDVTDEHRTDEEEMEL